MSLVRETRNTTVETFSKQLEYISKSHIAKQKINLKRLYSLVTFSSLELQLFKITLYQ